MDFGGKITLGSKAVETVKCSNCGKEITTENRERFLDDEKNEVYYCDECLETIKAEIKAQTENPNIIGGFFLGSAAAVVGSILWYLVAVLANVTIGYIAVGLGWLVALGVMFGAGGKRGRVLQLMAAAITLVAILASEFSVCLHLLAQQPEVADAQLWELAIALLFSPQTFFEYAISPVGLVIWGVGLYIAYITPKAQEI